MSAVRPLESFTYGARLFAYLLVVVIVGGGLLGIGAAVGYSDARALVGTGAYSTSELLGGAVLAFLGVFVLIAGWFGIVYKLLGDGIAAGTGPVSGTDADITPEETTETDSGTESVPAAGEPSGQPPEETADAGQQATGDAREPVLAGESEPESAPEDGGDPQPGEATAAEGEAVSEWESSVERPGRTGEGEAEQTPPEPTPEEIAFGSGDDDATDTDAESVEPAGSGAGDPLADPTDDG